MTESQTLNFIKKVEVVLRNTPNSGGLRIVVDKANSPLGKEKGSFSKYVVDIIKKVQREEIKSLTKNAETN